MMTETGSPASAPQAISPSNQWFVAICGDGYDFRRLAELELAPFQIVQQEKWMCLTGAAFFALADHNAVLVHAQKVAIPHLRGLATLLIADHQFGDISTEGNVFRYDEAGNRDGRMFFEGECVITVRSEMKAELSGGSPSFQPPDPFPTQAVAALQRPEVAEIVALVNSLDDLNWAVNVHKIWELIQSDVGKQYAPQGAKKFLASGLHQIKAKKWLTPEEIESLRSVHAPEIVGPAARHAVHESDLPQHQLHSRREATALLRKLIKPWIQAKLPRASTTPT